MADHPNVFRKVPHWIEHGAKILKIELVLVVILAALCVTLASGTVTTFKKGPFCVSVDLGVP
jgi:hypothetical protein